MQIVTITYKDDFNLLLLQLQSMDKFLEPCTVNVVINETSDLNIYKRQIKSNVHNIKIWSQHDILQRPVPNQTSGDGWCSQQLLKMLIPIDDNYISLDCKDMFIKPTTLSMLTRRQRRLRVDPSKTHPWIEFYNIMFKHLWRYYKKRIKYKNLDNIQTPRVIKKSVVNKIPDIWGSNKKFIKWWGQFGMPSEFIMYDCIQQLEQKDQMNTFEKHEIVAVWYEKDIDFYAIKDNTFMLKIHRRVYNNPKTQKIVTDWIKKLLTTP